MIGVHRAANWLLTAVFGPQIGVYNGVAARDRSILHRDHEPDHKQHLVRAVRDHVDPGDDVVVVGGGRAVVAVHAAKLGGEVTVYEAGDSAFEVTESAKKLNDVHMRTVHAVVGSPGAVTGASSTLFVDPETLNGDVLVLDCEGAERDILPVDGFETVIVETHPAEGAPLSAITDRLPNADAVEIVGPDPIDGEVIVA